MAEVEGSVWVLLRPGYAPKTHLTITMMNVIIVMMLAKVAITVVRFGPSIAMKKSRIASPGPGKKTAIIRRAAKTTIASLDQNLSAVFK